MKYLKISIFILCFLCLSAVVAGAIFLRSFDINSYKTEIETAVSDTLGREFKINGNMGFVLAMTPTLSVENLTLANKDWGKDKNMLSVESVSVKLGLLSLIKGNIRINACILQ